MKKKIYHVLPYLTSLKNIMQAFETCATLNSWYNYHDCWIHISVFHQILQPVECINHRAIFISMDTWFVSLKLQVHALQCQSSANFKYMLCSASHLPDQNKHKKKNQLNIKLRCS